jgi:hypothetical protein
MVMGDVVDVFMQISGQKVSKSKVICIKMHARSACKKKKMRERKSRYMHHFFFFSLFVFSKRNEWVRERREMQFKSGAH